MKAGGDINKVIKDRCGTVTGTAKQQCGQKVQEAHQIACGEVSDADKAICLDRFVAVEQSLYAVQEANPRLSKRQKNSLTVQSYAENRDEFAIIGRKIFNDEVKRTKDIKKLIDQIVKIVPEDSKPKAKKALKRLQKLGEAPGGDKAKYRELLLSFLTQAHEKLGGTPAKLADLFENPEKQIEVAERGRTDSHPFVFGTQKVKNSLKEVEEFLLTEAGGYCVFGEDEDEESKRAQKACEDFQKLSEDPSIEDKEEAGRAINEVQRGVINQMMEPNEPKVIRKLQELESELLQLRKLVAPKGGLEKLYMRLKEMLTGQRLVATSTTQQEITDLEHRIALLNGQLRNTADAKRVRGLASEKKFYLGVKDMYSEIDMKSPQSYLKLKEVIEAIKEKYGRKKWSVEGSLHRSELELRANSVEAEGRNSDRLSAFPDWSLKLKRNFYLGNRKVSVGGEFRRSNTKLQGGSVEGDTPSEWILRFGPVAEADLLKITEAIHLFVGLGFYYNVIREDHGVLIAGMGIGSPNFFSANAELGVRVALFKNLFLTAAVGAEYADSIVKKPLEEKTDPTVEPREARVAGGPALTGRIGFQLDFNPEDLLFRKK